MNIIKHGITALLSALILTAASSSSFAYPVSLAGFELNPSLQLAYYNIKTGEKRYSRNAPTPEKTTAEVETTRGSSCAHYRPFPKPISVPRNQECEQEYHQSGQRRKQEVSNKVF